MSLISVEVFRELFDIDSDITDKRIELHIGSAARRLRKWVGDTNYALASVVGAGEQSDLEIVNDLRNAEAHLTFHFAIHGFNAPLSSKGVVGTNMASEGKEVRKYLSPDETAKLAGQFLELAREIAEPYMTPIEDVGFETAEIGCDA